MGTIDFINLLGILSNPDDDFDLKLFISLSISNSVISLSLNVASGLGV